MPDISIDGVPDDVHEGLLARAAAAGVPLEEYLLREVTRVAREPTLAEVKEWARRRPSGRMSFCDAERWVREDRDSR